jgi:soluble lytic murein transglycosylase-like protein
MLRSFRFALPLVFAVVTVPAVAPMFGFVKDSTALLDQPRIGYTLFVKDPPAPVRQTVVAAPVTPLAAPAKPVLSLPPRAVRNRYADMVAKVAREQNVDAALLKAVMTVESGYNVRAKSPKGASGLMQLIPETARRFGVKNIWNPLENIRGGARYLNHLLHLFNGEVELALAAYNAGPGAVIKYGREIPPYPETRNYVPRVLEHYKFYRGETKL